MNNSLFRIRRPKRAAQLGGARRPGRFRVRARRQPGAWPIPCREQYRGEGWFWL